MTSKLRFNLIIKGGLFEYILSREMQEIFQFSVKVRMFLKKAYRPIVVSAELPSYVGSLSNQQPNAEITKFYGWNAI